MRFFVQTIYLFSHCNAQQKNKNFFLITFENLSLEMLNLLITFSKNQSTIKLAKAENYKVDNDLESNFQLNNNIIQHSLSNTTTTLCLLVSTNPRFEGYMLNLILKQKYLKGNFDCFILGSLINLTFPTFFLGSNLNTLRSILTGTNIFCQKIKSSKKPIMIFNYEFFKRNDTKYFLDIFKKLKHTNLFNKYWNGFNILSPSLHETGLQYSNNFLPLSRKDLTNFNSIFVINTSTINIPNLKKITELKLLNYSQLKNKTDLFLDFNTKIKNNVKFLTSIHSMSQKKLNKYCFLPSTTFYENEETYINTEGKLKRTTKFIFQKNTKSNWQILRKMFKFLKNNIIFLNEKDNYLINFNLKNMRNIRNYFYFQYQSTCSLTNINFYLTTKNENFTLLDNNFKNKRLKLKSTKLKYWLDDFYNDGKDGYSYNSFTLSKCSNVNRLKSTNFF